MAWQSSDRDWERLGRIDPYWAVLSDEPYRGSNLSEDQLRAFLKTGTDDVDMMWRICRQTFGETFAPGRVLDFGCGVGRVTLPLAQRADSVVAVDVAASMLTVARSLLERHGVSNVQLVQSDAGLTGVQGPFDLVHSVLVFQHIPVASGLRLIRRLVDLAGERGVVALHVLYHNPFRRSPIVRFTHGLLRPFRRGRLPDIQMNAYPLETLFSLIQQSGAGRMHVEFTNHGGHLGAILFFRKETARS